MNSNANDLPVGSVKWWDEYFLPGGGWEQNQGRMQTTVFAEAFIRHVKLPRDEPFGLLDVGCALGDAIRLFRESYPEAILMGIDISHTAISRCQREFGHIASFEVKKIEEIDQSFDIIYASAVLEHYTDYPDKARHLIRHCKRLFIYVPFQEMRHGRPLEPDPQAHHQCTFDCGSFDFLLDEKLASSIKTQILRCPGAWSFTWVTWAKEHLIKNPLRFLCGKAILRNPKMILYDVHSAKKVCEGEKRKSGTLLKGTDGQIKGLERRRISVTVGTLPLSLRSFGVSK